MLLIFNPTKKPIKLESGTLPPGERRLVELTADEHREHVLEGPCIDVPVGTYAEDEGSSTDPRVPEGFDPADLRA